MGKVDTRHIGLMETQECGARVAGWPGYSKSPTLSQGSSQQALLTSARKHSSPLSCSGHLWGRHLYPSQALGPRGKQTEIQNPGRKLEGMSVGDCWRSRKWEGRPERHAGERAHREQGAQ